jgi:hypothetical protein
VGLHAGARNAWVEKTRYFLFLGILMDERFNFLSSSFRRAEIDFDVDFIMRTTNFSLIDTPSSIIQYRNKKTCDFFVLYRNQGQIGHAHKCDRL